MSAGGAIENERVPLLADSGPAADSQTGRERLPLLVAGRQAASPAGKVGGPPSAVAIGCPDCTCIAAATRDAPGGKAALAAYPPPGSQASKSPPLHPAGCPWGLTSALLLADMCGVGALSLVSVFARLGWLLSLCFLVSDQLLLSAWRGSDSSSPPAALVLTGLRLPGRAFYQTGSSDAERNDF